MPAFIMIGSMIIPAISPGCSSKARATASRSLNGTMIVERHDGVGDARAGGDVRRPARRSDVAGVGRDRDLDRVVVPVVAALDLQDQIAARDRPHEMNRVHRRLGTRVAETPERLAEPAGELLGDEDRVFCGLCEVRPAADLGPHGLDDRGMGVTGQAGAVAAVQVDVLGPVDVVDLGTGPVTEPYGLRTRDLPAGGHARRRATLSPDR